MYLQTGDVLYKQVDKFPTGRKTLKGNLIHQGDNHSHTISGKFALSQKDGVMFIEAKGSCKLLHAEHKTVTLPKGKYKKDIVVEYDHFSEESRQVVD